LGGGYEKNYLSSVEYCITIAYQKKLPAWKVVPVSFLPGLPVAGNFYALFCPWLAFAQQMNWLIAGCELLQGHIECDSETVFELAAHVLQASKGDFNR